mmetsp:Transcript_24058/g.66929  ORF Transcript_24058/g.66929 Transcript_24058/m.66929 type:complete len:218 (-) Transcript_24058:18-671(-)
MRIREAVEQLVPRGGAPAFAFPTSHARLLPDLYVEHSTRLQAVAKVLQQQELSFLVFKRARSICSTLRRTDATVLHAPRVQEPESLWIKIADLLVEPQLFQRPRDVLPYPVIVALGVPRVARISHVAHAEKSRGSAGPRDRHRGREDSRWNLMAIDVVLVEFLAVGRFARGPAPHARKLPRADAATAVASRLTVPSLRGVSAAVHATGGGERVARTA